MAKPAPALTGFKPSLCHCLSSFSGMNCGNSERIRAVGISLMILSLSSHNHSITAERIAGRLPGKKSIRGEFESSGHCHEFKPEGVTSMFTESLTRSPMGIAE